MRYQIAAFLFLLPLTSLLALPASAQAEANKRDLASSPSPRALYSALLTTDYPDSQLPRDFKSARVRPLTPFAGERDMHVVGDVEVDVLGPDSGDHIFYAVFANAADARADLVSVGWTGQRRIGTAPGYRRSVPSAFFTGKAGGIGSTAVAVVVGNVRIDAKTESSGNRTGGSVPRALALLKSGLHHLRAVETALLKPSA